MANPIYARLQATAKRLIGEFGQAGAVRRETPPDPEFACSMMRQAWSNRSLHLLTGCSTNYAARAKGRG